MFYFIIIPFPIVPRRPIIVKVVKQQKGGKAALSTQIRIGEVSKSQVFYDLISLTFSTRGLFDFCLQYNYPRRSVVLLGANKK